MSLDPVITPRDLPTENVLGLTVNDLIEHYNSLTLQNEKIKFKNMFLKGLYLNPSRIAMQELTSGTLSVSGWYTIAELDVGSFETVMATFSFGFFGLGRLSALKVEVGFSASNLTRDFNNVTCKIVNFTNIRADRNQGVLGVRIAKSDSVTTSGAKLQVNLDINTDGNLITQLSENIGFIVGLQSEGWTLTEPTQTDIGLLPDGVTPATFLEAGAELSFALLNGAFQAQGISFYNSSSNDQIRVCVDWPEIPKQGTGLTITGTISSILIKGYDGSTGATLSGFTVSNLIFDNKKLYFNINQTGISTSLTDFEGGYFIFQSEDIVLTITG